MCHTRPDWLGDQEDPLSTVPRQTLTQLSPAISNCNISSTEFHTGARLAYGRTILRAKYPSIETLKALLYRSGVVAAPGVVVVAFDPFAAWAEACALVGLPCVLYVTDTPTDHIRTRVDRMWRSLVVPPQPANSKRGRVTDDDTC